MSEGLDLGFLDDLQDHRHTARRRRARAGLGVSIAITVAWAVFVVTSGHLGRVADNWVASITMVAGSFVAGSTPQGGGAVAFPVLTKGLEVPAEVARSFSLCIQTVGMGAAATVILITRRTIARLAVLVAGPCAAVTFVITVVLVGDPDRPFLPAVVPGPYVKVTFTLVVASMAFIVWLGSRVPIREVRTSLPPATPRRIALLALGGTLGGLSAALVGSGADVLVYLFVVVLFGLDPRVGVPTSVLTMATVSITGFVVLGLLDGQLSVGLAGEAVATLDGNAVALAHDAATFGPGEPLPATRFDLFGLWIAAVPVVAWGAPLGSWAASKLSARTLVGFVAALATAEVVSTIIFLEDLRTDAALAGYAVVGLVVLLTVLSLAKRARHEIVGVPAVDTGRTLVRGSLDVADGYRTALDPAAARLRDPAGPADGTDGEQQAADDLDDRQPKGDA